MHIRQGLEALFTSILRFSERHEPGLPLCQCQQQQQQAPVPFVPAACGVLVGKQRVATRGRNHLAIKHAASGCESPALRMSAICAGERTWARSIPYFKVPTPLERGSICMVCATGWWVEV